MVMIVTRFLPVSHENEGGNTVEGGHQKVCNGNIDKEVIGHTPHSSVS